MRKFLIKNWPEITFAVFAFIFSFWLMTSTFSSDPKAGTISISAKAWSDFAANIPLIRSFSQGQNFPPEYPLFPGEPIRYHFLFYLLVGFLEKSGLPSGWALNLPSILGFSALLLMIYFLAKLLFKSRIIAILSVIFFLFNGSFGFYYFFQKHPLSFPQTILDIATTQDFSAFGPYDRSPVTAFWNLNIYTNQRHFASGLFLTLLPLYLIFKTQRKKQTLSLKTTLLLGIIAGFLPFWHATGFVMSLVILGGLFFFFPMRRRILLIILIALLLAFPQLLYLNQSGGISSLQWNPGYLVSTQLSLFNFLRFWVLNLGLGFFLIPLGIIFASRNIRWAFLVVLPVFILGNLFQFSPDMAINHKFFNLFLIVGNMFSAFAIVYFWKKRLLFKIITPFLILFLTLSGIIDFFAIKNDRSYTLSDAPRNPDVVWIKNNTPPSSVFLNSTYLYHPASLAGRKIFLGWPYFSWSTGYDTDHRYLLQNDLYRGGEITKICQILRQNKIDYVETQKVPDQAILINYDFWGNNFLLLYNNPENNLKIYSVEKTCR